jgi:hypothetical protein
MLLQEAVEMMKNGCHMVRKDWTEKDGYLTTLPKADFVWKVVFTGNVPNAGNYIFDIEDILAGDWRELDLSEPEPEIMETEEQEAA